MLAARKGAQRSPTRLPMSCPVPQCTVKPGRTGCSGMAATGPGEHPSVQAASLGGGAQGRRGRSALWLRPIVGGQGVPGGPEGQGGQHVQSGRADAKRASESRGAAAVARRTLGPTATASCLPSAPRRGDPQPRPDNAATGSGYGTPCTSTACKNQSQTACQIRSSEQAYLCKLVSRQGGEQGGEERWESSGQFSAREPRNTMNLH